MKRSKMEGTGIMRIIATVFTLCGVLMLYGAIHNAVSIAKFYKNAIETTGMISQIETTRDSDGDTHHTVYVSYTVDGILYESIQLPYYVTGMYEGDAITLYYTPENPKHVETKTGSMFEIIIFTVMGIIFTAIGVGFMIPIIKRNTMRRLKKTGRCVRLPITSIEINNSIRVNGIPAHYIICEEVNPATGKKFIYKSSNYYAYLDSKMQAGDIVPIYIDVNDSDKYYMDVENVEPGNFTAPGLAGDTFSFNSDPVYDTTYADRETAASAKDNYSLNSSDDSYQAPF